MSAVSERLKKTLTMHVLCKDLVLYTCSFNGKVGAEHSRRAIRQLRSKIIAGHCSWARAGLGYLGWRCILLGFLYAPRFNRREPLSTHTQR